MQTASYEHPAEPPVSPFALPPSSLFHPEERGRCLWFRTYWSHGGGFRVCFIALVELLYDLPLLVPASTSPVYMSAIFVEYSIHRPRVSASCASYRTSRFPVCISPPFLCGCACCCTTSPAAIYLWCLRGALAARMSCVLVNCVIDHQFFKPYDMRFARFLRSDLVKHAARWHLRVLPRPTKLSEWLCP